MPEKERIMPKGSPELTAARREEIMNACEQLYKTMSFHDITLKEIGEVTSFSRPSIYNYFKTKEEIFLALFEREYDLWTEDLTTILTGNEQLSHEQLAGLVAISLEKRKLLLKILSVNLYDMEENSRMERLVSFKLAYKRSTEAVKALAQKFCPEMDTESIESKDCCHAGKFEGQRHKGCADALTSKREFTRGLKKFFDFIRESMG